MQSSSPTPERSGAGAPLDRRFPVMKFWTYVLWTLIACAYGYLLIHTCINEGPDFHSVYAGPKATLDGMSPYPTSSNPAVYFRTGQPYFIFPPGAPILLSPLGLFSRHIAWIAFAVLSILLLPTALAWVIRSMRPVPSWAVPLALLGVAMFLPYQQGLNLGNVDVLCAGVILAGLGLMMRRSCPTAAALGGILVGCAVALKPTLWPIALVVLAMTSLASRVGVIAGAAVPTAIGLWVVPGVDRFFTYVLPELSKGEVHVGAEREALGDLVRSAGAPTTAITVSSLVLIAAATTVLLVACARAQTDHPGQKFWRFAALGPIIPLALALAPYGLSPYAIYLVVALPFVVIGSRPWMALAAGFGIFAMGASVTLRLHSGPLDSLLQWRFLVGLAVLFVVTAVGLWEWLRDRPVLGLGAP